jgi:hypothetical protein
MTSRHRRKRTHRKRRSRVALALTVVGIVLFTLVTSLTAFYSGRYDLLERFGAPARVDE